MIVVTIAHQDFCLCLSDLEHALARIDTWNDKGR